MKTQKELKEEYKLRKARIGIYTITHLDSKKIFIGSALDLDKKWNSDKFKLNAGSHKCKMLQEEWHKYGESSFGYDVLYEIPQNDETKIINYNEEMKVLIDLYIEEKKETGIKCYN